MLLNLRIVELHSSIQYHIPIGAFIGLLFSIILIFIYFFDLKGIAIVFLNQESFFQS
jgi:hypothetical protein